MMIRIVALSIGLGLIGCASQPAVAPSSATESQTPEPHAATAVESPAVVKAAPAPVEAAAAEPSAAPELPVPESAPRPVVTASVAEKKKKIAAKPAAPPAKPAAAVVVAPPSPQPPAVPAKPAIPSVTAYSGPDACTLAIKGDSSVAAACAKGGVKDARKEMKRMLKKAKEAGHKTDCDDCHPDDDFGKLTNDGREKFKELARLGAM